MIAQVSIIIEKNESSYVAYCPSIEGSKIQGDSLDTVINEIKEVVEMHLSKNEDEANNKVDKPIWEIAQELVADITEEELNQLPTDGAEQHDHYIYGIPKREG